MNLSKFSRRLSVLEAAALLFTAAPAFAATDTPTLTPPADSDRATAQKIIDQSIADEAVQKDSLNEDEKIETTQAAPVTQPTARPTQPAYPQAPAAQNRAAAPAPAPNIVTDRRPVSQEQFRQAILVLKRTVERLDRTENELARVKANPGASDDTVDLTKVSSAKTAGPGNGQNLAAPNFKVYFDFNLVNRPGQDNLSFKNYHNFLFFELSPTPAIQFSFDAIGYKSPNYYELDLQVNPKLQVRLGKIWIPFDDLSPHNLFGGRVDVSLLSTSSNSNEFLPDIWADLGVGIKYQLIDTKLISVETHLYVVNGFGSGGTDPTGGGNPYPNFNSTTGINGAADNNRDKAIGGRVRATFLSGLSVGASFQTGRWSNEAEPSERYSILGLDSQLRIGRTELRGGLALMNVGLEPGTSIGGDSFSRAGAYVEAGMKFGALQNWKGLFRTGIVQLDNRGDFSNDQDIVGGTVLYKPGLIEYSLEYSRDLLIRAGKLSYSYTAARVIIGL